MGGLWRALPIWPPPKSGVVCNQ